jgi:hypothetical protein
VSAPSSAGSPVGRPRHAVGRRYSYERAAHAYRARKLFGTRVAWNTRICVMGRGSVQHQNRAGLSREACCIVSKDVPKLL